MSNGPCSSLFKRRPKRIVLYLTWLVFATLAVVLSGVAQANQTTVSNAQQSSETDWNAVEQALGKAGSLQPGDVYRVSFPRTDLKVTVGGVQVKAPLALGCSPSFKRAASR